MEVVERKPKSLIEEFACEFHQDFGVLGLTVKAHGEALCRKADSSDLIELKKNFSSLLLNFSGKRGKGLEKAWRKLGADYVPKEIKEIIECWVEL